jgi:hypothetical protein
MVRSEVDALADLRALNIQHNRTNPLSGRKKLSRDKMPPSTPSEPFPPTESGFGSGTKKGMMRKTSRKAYEPSMLDGAGAVPSMGLSQFRGGRRMGKKLMSHLMKTKGEGYVKGMMCGMGAGSDSESDESESEDEKMSGKGACEHCRGGMGTGRYEGQGKQYVMAEPSVMSVDQRRDMLQQKRMKAGEEEASAFAQGGAKQRIRAIVSKMKPKEEGGMGAGMSGGLNERNMIIKQIMDQRGISRKEASQVAKKEGFLKGIRKAASDPSKPDGRKKRAEIVKKVMKEKGMKMVEASKYVKEHNLYKK